MRSTENPSIRRLRRNRPWRKRLAFEWGGGGYRCALDRTDFRTLDPLYTGRIFTWDIDQTYLQTEIKSLRHLIQIPFELAVDKRAIPGTPSLLKGIRRGTEGRFQQVPLYFVSASPPQLRSVIERKMLLDGVNYDGITFKNQLAHLLRFRPDRLREQVGYKLSALLLNRRAHPPKATEILFGDDSESDAFIYETYQQIISGELRGAPLRGALLDRGVEPADAEYVRLLSEGMESYRGVEKIFIHRTGHGKAVDEYKPNLHFTQTPFQAAVSLWKMDAIDEDALMAVGTECEEHSSLHTQLADGVARGVFHEEAKRDVSRLLVEFLHKGGTPN